MRPARSRLPLFAVSVILLTTLATAGTEAVLNPAKTWIAVLFVGLLAVGYFGLALSASTIAFGMLPRTRATPRRAAATATPRTALLLPIYDERPEQIARAVRVMADSLDTLDGITIHILSDTQNPAIAAREARTWPPTATTRTGIEVNYRRRNQNIGRKAGNLMAFCRGEGHAYDFAIVLDADSLMTGDAIRALIAELRDDPHAALVQSVPYPVGAETLFGRMQQFAVRLGTPLAVAGLHLWQQRRGSYWGHNAILRLSAFTEHADLPILRGAAPLGGEILCHDTIEAALLLRAGWAVRMAPDIHGSYETTPSNILDHLVREQRWCQGNLQHLRLVGAPGLLPESRFHIGQGILYYLSTPLGLMLSALLLAGVASFGADGHQAAPSDTLVRLMLWTVVALLFGPRIVSLIRGLIVPGVAAQFGGRLPLIASAVAEQIAATLLAPVQAVSITGFVIATFAGKIVTWDAAERGDRAIGLHEAWRLLRWHTAIGICITAGIAATQPAALPWTAPFLVGLIVSIPVAMASSSVWLGRFAGRLGLFLTEDELFPTPELAALTARENDGVARIPAMG